MCEILVVIEFHEWSGRMHHERIGARSGAPKFVQPSLPRHAPINKRMRACTDRGDRACVQPPGWLCVSARAAKSS